MIEKRFDISFIADLALREKQIQQNYRPIIAVHKWFARRPGTLFRGLLLSEFCEEGLVEAFYKSHRLHGIRIADPFMGGGTPLLEANRTGCEVIGADINPMAYWIVKQEIEPLPLNEYIQSAHRLRADLEDEIGNLYRTRCEVCGNESAHAKYFLWVKTIECGRCRKTVDLFPGYLIATDSRHPMNVFICPTCGGITEVESRERPGACRHCAATLHRDGPAKRGRCVCPECGFINRYPDTQTGPPKHRLFAIEYYCPSCKRGHSGRFFKIPDGEDLGRVNSAERRWARTGALHVPEEEIPQGDETNRLHRWGYHYYHQMFNDRQLLALETSARLISKRADAPIRNALATNLSDLLRYQNMLCRYDTTALKSLDIFSVHGFPVGLIQCESNFLGLLNRDGKICIGSGGWANIIEKFRRAKSYCDEPFEVRYVGRRKEIVPVKGEWIGDKAGDRDGEADRVVDLRCQDAAELPIKPRSLDAVFTDPPYFGNVQYAELMDFCYVWLRGLLRDRDPAFARPSTRNPGELTVNEDMGRGLDHFAEGLSSIFTRMAEALKPGSPLVFTYHHNDVATYYPVAVAVLDAGLACTASLPCPGEMGASIHISGTDSSIIDTVFVCRSTGSVPQKWVVNSIDGVVDLVRKDLASLRAANVKLTDGDVRCLTYGHLTRLAIWYLRTNWDRSAGTNCRIAQVASWFREFGGATAVAGQLGSWSRRVQDDPLFRAEESIEEFGAAHAEVPF
jgi:putative DNA methylase